MKYLLYAHGGSYNHGSEASLKCDIELLRRLSPTSKIILSSHFPEQDIQFGVRADKIIGRNVNGKSYEEIYRSTLDSITSDTICISIGGDVYCYPNWQRYAIIHKKAIEKKAKSILWSCSFEPTFINSELLDVLSSHHLIAVRESISEKILKDYGLKNVVRISDIAFNLEPKKTNIPNGKYIVLNLSPLIIKKNPKIVSIYQKFIDEIISNTEYNIVLIPHVEVSVDNDFDALSLLDGDGKRVIRIPTGLSAAEYKYIISKSEYCIAARTHITIAAWSTIVPTIAIGYSTKAYGIAKDLGQEEYVVDINSITYNQLSEKFKQLQYERNEVCTALSEKVNECKKLLDEKRLEHFLKKIM